MKPKPGDIVHIVFLDHCRSEGSELPGLIRVETFGRVVRVTDEELLLAWWMEESGLIDNNSELLVIARSTIKKIRRLR